MNELEELKVSIRIIPDFPIKGVEFSDITTTLLNPKYFRMAMDKMAEIVKKEKVDKIIGIDARGFIFGAAVSYVLGKGFIPARKEGKLPYYTVSESFTKEYGGGYNRNTY